MSVFLKNICNFEGCGEIFKSLNDLIEHIEIGHVDFDPEVVQQLELQKPKTIPLSYALRYSSIDLKSQCSPDLPPEGVALEHNYSLPFRNGFGSDCELDDVDLGELYENDLDEELRAEFIMRYGCMQSMDGNDRKPFACPVPGCNKRYKNVNGIKYHAKNGHKKNKCKKGLTCHCGKVYKTENGLKNHASMVHGYSQMILPKSSSVFQPLEIVQFLTINELPSPFDSMRESNGNSCSEMSKTDTDVGSSDLQNEQVAVLEEKSEVATNKTRIENQKKSNPSDDVIDVGDVNDCVYP